MGVSACYLFVCFRRNYMDRKEFNITVPTKKNYNEIVNGLYQNDVGSIINLTFVDEGNVLNFDGSVVVVRVLRPDGKWYLANIVNGLDPRNGLVAIETKPEMVSLVGMHYMTVEFSINGSVFVTSTVNYFVSENKSVPDEEFEDDDRIPLLSELITQVSDIIAQENERKIAEKQRNINERERQSNITGLENLYAKMRELYNNFVDAVEDSKEVLLTDWTTKFEYLELSEKVDNVPRYATGDSEPSDKNVLWLRDGVIHYWNGSAWVTAKCEAVFR